VVVVVVVVASSAAAAEAEALDLRQRLTQKAASIRDFSQIRFCVSNSRHVSVGAYYCFIDQRHRNKFV